MKIFCKFKIIRIIICSDKRIDDLFMNDNYNNAKIHFQIQTIDEMFSFVDKEAIKRTFFSGFMEIKCFDLYSHTLLMIIYTIRFISEMTIIDFSAGIDDSTYKYFQTAYKMITLHDLTEKSSIQLFVAIFIVTAGSVAFWYCMFSLSSNIKTKHIKTVYLKLFGVFVHTFRVLLVKNCSDMAVNFFKSNQFGWVAASCLIILIMLIHSILFEHFCIQISLNTSKKSLLSKSYHIFNSLSEGILLVSIFVGSILPQSENILFVFIICVLLAFSFSFRLLSLTLRKKYSNQWIETLETITCVSGLVFYLILIPGYYVELLKANLSISIIIVSIFCYSTFTNWLGSFRQDSLSFLESISKTKEQLVGKETKLNLCQAHYLIHYINYLMVEYKREEQQILLSSILAQHFRVCKKHQCYCYNKNDQNINKLMMDISFRGKFLLAFVQNVYKQFSDEFDIFVLYLMFKFEIIGIFPQIQYAILKYQNCNPSLGLAQQSIIFQIKRALKDVINAKNRGSDFVKVQKAILQEQNSKKLLQSLHEAVQMNIKRYKLLSQGICNLRSVQDNVQKASKVIKQIQLKYIKSKQENEFNLYTQSIFYFYFTKLSETNSEVNSIWTNIYTKGNFLKSLKGMTASNIQKFLYDDNCCVLQTNLDPENMGIVTNLTSNSINLFGLRKQELLYRNVKKIMTKFMNDEHQILIQKWITSSQFGTFNQQKATFMTTIKNVCFKAVVYHQISTSLQRIKLYTMVLKLPGDNFLLMDRGLKIQGLGDKLKDSIFSVKTLKQNLKSYCLNSRILPQDVNEVDMEKKKNLEILFSQDKSSIGQIRNYGREADNFAEQIKEFANKALRANRQVRVFKCKVELFVMKIGSLPYFVMRFLDVIQHVMLQAEVDQIQQNSYQQNKRFAQKTTKSKMSRKKLLLGENSFTPKTAAISPQSPDYVEGAEQQKQSVSQSNDITQNGYNNEQQQQIQKQSTSSMVTQSTGYSFKKLIKQIKDKFLFEKNVNYPELTNITVLLLFLILVLMGALVTQYIFYSSKLNSFRKIMTANQQVSDTLQYLELMFSQSLSIYQNCVLIKNPVTCQKSVSELSYAQNRLFAEVDSQFQKIMTVKAADDFPYYIYLKENINVKIGRTNQDMQIQQFIYTFYYSVKKLGLYFQTSNTLNPQISNLFSILTDNWDAIVQMNHQILQLYQNKGFDQMNLITIILYCITGIIVLINFVIVLLINHFINSSLLKRQKIIRNYEWVPVRYIEEMKKYFEIVAESLNEKKIKRKEQIQYPICDESSYYRPKNQFFYAKSSVKRIIVLVIFFVCLTAGNGISLFKMRKVLQPFETIFLEQKRMIVSQKNIIQAYYELKKNYLLESNSTIRQQRLMKLQRSFQKKEVEFNDRAIKLLQIFNDSSSEYFYDFKSLLTGDICELSKDLLTQWEYNLCKKANLDYPKFGIFSSMIFIQRATMAGEIILKKSPLSAAPFILSSPTYQDIDLYIVYIVKVFYMMQKRINQQMQTFLDNAYLACLIMIMLQFLLICAGVAIWAWFYREKMKQFIKLYGQVILFPNKIIVKNKQVLRQIQYGLVIKDF